MPKLWSESSGPEDNTPGGPMDYSCEETHDGCGIWVPRATTALFISPLCIKKNGQEREKENGRLTFNSVLLGHGGHANTRKMSSIFHMFLV
ncbi:hypothetical protein V1478_011167 [Vespula squamosa]|uniref:Uncharacterized protein n=1 Tax=Vespula squamosa TaxID=30214 RepID=A0ABD2ADR6_VESSQ